MYYIRNSSGDSFRKNKNLSGFFPGILSEFSDKTPTEILSTILKKKLPVDSSGNLPEFYGNLRNSGRIPKEWTLKEFVEVFLINSRIALTIFTG